jgi:hypothetical protein
VKLSENVHQLFTTVSRNPPFVFFFLILVLPIAGTGLYLLYKGQLKLLLVYIAFVTVVVGHFALKYYMNSDPQVLPGVIRS